MTISLTRFRAELNKSEAEETLAWQIKAQGLLEPVRQYLFAKEALGRKWAADFCWPTLLWIVEVDGGTYVAGRHTRGTGFEADRERDAEAMCLGYRVLHVTTKQVESGQALAWLERLLK